MDWAFKNIRGLLCYQAQSFPNILGITITSHSGRTVLITRNEFQLLAMISQPQRLDAKSLLKEMGQVFLMIYLMTTEHVSLICINRSFEGPIGSSGVLLPAQC